MVSCCIFVFKQKTAYEMRISDWSSDVCSSDLACIDRVDSPGTRMDLGGRGLCTDWRGARDGDAGRIVEGITQGHPDFTKLFESRSNRSGPVIPGFQRRDLDGFNRSEEHTSELQSLMRISYAVF